jgi:hypothetical protein
MVTQTKANMRILLKHIHHRPSESLTRMIEQQMETLGRSFGADEVRIAVERRLEANPPFRVRAHFVTAGPEIIAEALDRTLRGALRKTVAQFETWSECCRHNGAPDGRERSERDPVSRHASSRRTQWRNSPRTGRPSLSKP